MAEITLMSKSPKNTGTELHLAIDGAYVMYHAIYSAVKKWKEDSPNASVIDFDKEDMEKPDFVPPDITPFSDFRVALKEAFSSCLFGIRRIVDGATSEFGGYDVDYGRSTGIFSFDSREGHNWRFDIFPDYKANRKLRKNPFDIKPVRSYFHDVILPGSDLNGKLGLKVIEIPGVEGDDIIATFFSHWYNETDIGKGGINILVASDHDFLQMPRTVCQYTLEGKRVLPDEYQTVIPDSKQFLLSKIITGDDSDNIPQVFSRVGYKTALKKYVFDPENLKAALAADPVAKAQFVKNTKLIDFSFIPKRVSESVNKVLGLSTEPMNE
jgi:hypothetical protein